MYIFLLKIMFGVFLYSLIGLIFHKILLKFKFSISRYSEDLAASAWFITIPCLIIIGIPYLLANKFVNLLFPK